MDTPTCPTCGRDRNGAYRFSRDHYARSGVSRLGRRGGKGMLGQFRSRKVAVVPSRGASGTRVMTHSRIQCVDPWHDRHPRPVARCHLSCVIHGDLPHWHEPGDGRVLCPGACYNAAYDPTDEHSVLYDTPEGYDEPHYHVRTDLPRQHDPERRQQRIRQHRRHQAKDHR